MKNLIYVGQEGLNFGRWRWIEHGDVLELTEAEAEGAIAKKAAKLKADRVKSTSKEAEAGREERVEKENTFEKFKENELQNMTKEELRNRAGQIQGAGGAIDVRPQMSKKQLIAEIIRSTSKLD